MNNKNLAEQCEKIHEYASKGATIQNVAIALGLTISGFREKLQRFPELHESFKTGADQYTNSILNDLIERRKNGDPHALKEAIKKETQQQRYIRNAEMGAKTMNLEQIKSRLCEFISEDISIDMAVKITTAITKVDIELTTRAEIAEIRTRLDALED